MVKAAVLEFKLAEWWRITSVDAKKGFEELLLEHGYTHLENRFCNLTLQLVALNDHATKVYRRGVLLALSD